MQGIKGLALFKASSSFWLLDHIRSPEYRARNKEKKKKNPRPHSINRAKLWVHIEKGGIMHPSSPIIHSLMATDFPFPQKCGGRDRKPGCTLGRQDKKLISETSFKGKPSINKLDSAN